MYRVKEKMHYFIEYCNKKLKNNLVGIYLHGSLAMGCFNSNLSDIDILIVVKSDFTLREKRELIGCILKLSEAYGKNDFEISIILEEYAKNFVYPTPYILHYSKKYKEIYFKNSNFICGNGVDFDLAAHITVIKNRGICLLGKPIEQVFGAVPKNCYIDSIIRDIEDSKANILNNPLYYILNLCRVLYYVKEGVVSSKKEGGMWGISNLPKQFYNIIESALSMYECGSGTIKADSKELMKFCDYMLGEIMEKK
ncbi:MAG TPA: DUF4111 domain-containing protein [Clostridiaceae bacterium]|nr:DUF4111 domain-containing protein [Clostridiaceae bacterium]